MLCPDTEQFKEFYKLRNDYNNIEEKTSLSIEIALCNNVDDDSKICE